ncbi:helix-turn-helix transcriptional regulator [Pseudomonas aeruginosa]|jgi:transcriptional regulator with XRE-family HTH domain|uniref:Helix-turn-helix domain-containing protein n=2 Tax=Pseudomonadota TaxID=1224 RepID=A0ABY7N9B9_ALCFA|nr:MULTISPECIES: helix-turn-helix transcriptional regulator [Pseudomonadota]EGJ7432050.1 helix-turn-helix transcriptional regulator [Escherichia coli]MBO9352463.1 helix-turn-helix domain-containing protein [Bordetella petrii]HED2942857.1 helix-turn-helix transcriptional regulator [Enterobacter hormaechei subsp. xiangfangensis]EIU3183420.1 helix-turn-helix transcriptional regulator [Pseudomonas aeruginosa]EIU3230325.1 helix-turn-helix transcriptional regulator [Pseudomonas aeruginosa]|tara:strand:- start:1174 stop:1467 length:294 start_codon:yes stop_codon:yes gene_type:complete
MTAFKPSLPDALRRIRKARGLSQEAFSDVSSRTYLSSLERGLKSPTLNKIEDVCAVLDVHPLTLLVLAYAGSDPKNAHELMDHIAREVSSFSEHLNK